MSRKRGMASRWRLAERTCRRVSTLETGMQCSDRYGGARLFRHRWTVTASLKRTPQFIVPIAANDVCVCVCVSAWWSTVKKWGWYGADRVQWKRRWLSVIRSKWPRRCVGVFWMPRDVCSGCVCQISSSQWLLARPVQPARHGKHSHLLLILLVIKQPVVSLCILQWSWAICAFMYKFCV